MINPLKKLFTIIELVVVIIILGILTAILIPNISNWQEEAIKAEVISNTRNLQTIVDMYAMEEEGTVPTTLEPTLGKPQFIDFERLYTKYSKTKKPKHGYYWVDYQGKVWGSTVDAPIRVKVEGVDVKFEHVQNAGEYELFVTNTQGQATGKISNRILKSLGLFINSDKKKIVTIPISNKEEGMYLVSAYDKFGLSTPPVGEDYAGYNQTLPIQGIGTFYLITNANAKAIWEGIVVREDKPAGTDIKYSFATSDNGKDYSAFTSNIKELPNSQYMKVKVEMITTNHNLPTLHYLKVQFRVIGEDTVIVIPPTGPLKLEDGETSKEFVQIVETTNPDYFENVDIIGTIPEGTKVEQTYQSSPDGVNWSEPTPYPEELPPAKFIKITTEVSRNNPSTPSPVIDSMIIEKKPNNPNVVDYVVPPAPEQTTPEQNNEDWETISSINIVEDANEVGDWINVEITENNPVGTRILYKYYNASSEPNWTGPFKTVEEVPNSRFFKVEVIYQREKGTTLLPSLTSMTIHYKLGDGTLKTSTKGISPDGSVIEQPNYDQFQIKEFFTTETYRSSSTTADWLTGTFPITTQKIVRGPNIGSFDYIDDSISHNGYTVFIGNEASIVSNYARVVKVDQNYNIIKKIEFNDPYGKTISSGDFITKRINGGYLVVLNAASDNNVTFVELDENLKIIKQTILPYNNTADIVDIEYAGDSYIVSLENYIVKDYTRYSLGPTIRRYDSNLNLIKEVSYANPSTVTTNSLRGLKNIITTSNGDIYGRVVGKGTFSNQLGIDFGTSYSSVIIKMDKDFNLYSGINYFTNHSSNELFVKELDNSTLYIVDRGVIKKVDKNLNLLKETTFSNEWGSTKAVNVTNQGELMVATFNSTYNGYAGYNVLFFDKELNVTRTAASGSVGTREPRGVYQISDDKFMVTGSNSTTCGGSCQTIEHQAYIGDFEKGVYDVSKYSLASNKIPVSPASTKVKVLVDVDTPAGTDYDLALYFYDSAGESTTSHYAAEDRADGNTVLTLSEPASYISFKITLYGNGMVAPKVKFVGVEPVQ